ncbi:hypothetical protein E6W39_09660 [Kitasatospora acidiphila]|uniref:Mur ligase C-terminal domain-containing protein n=1 Tax=Kitasatospora acidiphila TaxID=2567942 RepID=A0A540WDX2_9ACTN|nr:hypothetical protein E6W39_09660 [Kitasatospora acidiphila]
MGDRPGRRRPARPPGRRPGAGRDHRHQRQDHHQLPAVLRLQRRRLDRRTAGHRGDPDRLPPLVRKADHPGGAGPAADPGPDARRRRGGRRDGGLLARAGPAPGRRNRLRRRHLHQPDARTPRLPRHHRAVLLRQVAALHPRTLPRRAGLRRRRVGERLAAQTTVPTIGFGLSERAQARITEVRADRRGIRLRLTGPDGPVDLSAPLIGECNATNVAAAYLAARALGVPQETAVAGIAHCGGIPGRSEAVDVGQPFLVLVDYAHTPGAIAAQLATARTLAVAGGRVHLVVGCRGGRDRYKRQDAGRVAITADTAILTSDSPGEEDPRAIVDQMLAGTLGQADGQVVVELDRAIAINLAIAVAGPGDVVLIVGRGHETIQYVAGHNLPFDDRKQARAALLAQGWGGDGDRAATWQVKADRLGLGVVHCHRVTGGAAPDADVVRS